MIKTIAHFAQTIRTLPLPLTRLSDARLLPSSLLVEQDGPISIYYAPFDHINGKAKVVFVGITPGRTQALLALNRARELLLQGHSPSDAVRHTKGHASFGGPMRTNLVRMLDDIGLAQRLRLHSCASLFDERKDLVHFTSALQYPVFLNGKDYNGTPSMLRTPLLRKYLELYMRRQLEALPSDALFLPLGPKVTEALLWLASIGAMKENRVLAGLPHPSGANAERIAIFLGSKPPAAASTKTNASAVLAAKRRLVEQMSVSM